MRQLTFVTVAILAAFNSGALAQSKFSATARWCGSSPEIRISGVPKGTAKLDLKMVDLDVPSYPHGGAQVAYQGQKVLECSEIAQASQGLYRPPGPPPGQVHTYQWTIQAVDARGKVLSQAVSQRKFPE
jgi:phosphatidylethanolamine-binding protein (PEBP) family uncharacterized protein